MFFLMVYYDVVLTNSPSYDGQHTRDIQLSGNLAYHTINNDPFTHICCLMIMISVFYLPDPEKLGISFKQRHDETSSNIPPTRNSCTNNELLFHPFRYIQIYKKSLKQGDWCDLCVSLSDIIYWTNLVSLLNKAEFSLFYGHGWLSSFCSCTALM